MTDHGPEVRELLKESRRGHYYCEDSWYSCPLAEGGCADARQPKAKCNCGASEWNARVEAALAAPPIEPVGVREALEAINTEWNKGKHGQGMDSFHAWYSAHIELIEAALITSEKPVVEEVVTVLTVRDHNWGCGFDAEDTPGKIKLCAYSTTKVNEGDRVRVVVYREEAE